MFGFYFSSFPCIKKGCDLLKDSQQITTSYLFLGISQQASCAVYRLTTAFENLCYGFFPEQSVLYRLLRFFRLFNIPNFLGIDRNTILHFYAINRKWVFCKFVMEFD